MMEKCAPMCNSCEALTLEFKCPLDPEAEDAWEPEDGLNKMFERLTAEPFKSKYSVEILSSPATDGPWVITMDDVVSAEEAFRLIELGHEVGYERSTDVGDLRADGTHLNVKSEGRTSTNAWCKDECEEDESTQAVNARLQEITGIPQINTENLQLLRYEPDQFYEVHHDYIPHHIRLQSGPRILTVYLYLNDVAAGGGTNFDDLDITVMPKRGRALLWPSTLDEAPDQKDERTTHQALPVEAGIKFGANAWYHLRDFRTPSSTGCMG
jgi:prolyl 4-hydroxylase